MAIDICDRSSQPKWSSNLKTATQTPLTDGAAWYRANRLETSLGL